MKDRIDEAKTQTLRTIKTQNDAFIVLCSLNLLNAAVKKPECEGLISYGFIKPRVMHFIQFFLAKKRNEFIDEIYYNAKQQCVYIRCFGIQFSFHNVGYDERLINLSKNKKVEWDGIPLQPIALGLYILAMGCEKNNLRDSNIIKDFF